MRRRIFSMVSVSPRLPLTWAQPVMPGFTLWRRESGEIRSANASLRAIGCGRGPTIDISPSSTFTSCGSSSIFVRLRIRPTRVTVHLQRDRSRRPVGGSAIRWNSGGPHDGASAHFKSYEYVDSSWGGVRVGLENKDLMV